jgi:Mg-chelatase subunit ChlI
MIPRAIAIFVINELPDLQARIQVALFNIFEGDIQIRGFKLECHSYAICIYCKPKITPIELVL